MKTLLALAVVLAAACVDDEVRAPVTLRDYAEVFGQAAEERAVECGKARADEVAEMVVDGICRSGLCNKPPRCNVNLDECVDALLVMSCASNEFPNACFDMYPGHGCLYGEAGHGRS